MFPLCLLGPEDVQMFDLYVCFYASSIKSVCSLKNVCQRKTHVPFKRDLKQLLASDTSLNVTVFADANASFILHAEFLSLGIWIFACLFQAV